MNYQLFSTAALEGLIRNPRTRDSQRIKIDEELRQRDVASSKRDTGTPSIFAASEIEARHQTSDVRHPTSDIRV